MILGGRGCGDRPARCQPVDLMIVLFTDYGLTGPYTGQVKAVLRKQAPNADIIDLFADAPAFDPMAAAYLLAAYAAEFPSGTVFLCVVDPGVGGARLPCVVCADGRWFVGPENGLFELVVRRAATPARWWHITWRPDRLSATFHGRDLFAPVAAHIAHDGTAVGREHPIAEIRRPDWPDDLPKVIYVDVFGNCMTGLRARIVPASAEITAGAHVLRHATTFESVPKGQPFWYENSNGLVEIAVNTGRASDVLQLGIGDRLSVTVGGRPAHGDHITR